MTHAFPTLPEYKDKCDRNEEKFFLPNECFTTFREPYGHVVVNVDEEKWQEYQLRSLRKPEEKATNSVKLTAASLEDDIGGMRENES